MNAYETLKRVKLISDEKAKQFQQDSVSEMWVPDQSIRSVLSLVVWRMFFDFQIELMKADAEEVCGRDPLIHDQFMGNFPPKPDPMEAAAIDAGYIRDVRDFIPDAPVKVRVTNHYFYPQDISEAQEGDIWHDLDGRPHFCLGDGWIEARGFKPNCTEGQECRVKLVEVWSNSIRAVSAWNWSLKGDLLSFKLV